MGRVLLIEDDPASLELFTYLLEAAGHDVTCATDGPSGVEAALARPPDLVLCDVGLPGLSGIEVLGRLRGQAALDGVPIVAVTAFAMVGDREELLAAGFDGYLSKPIDPERFVGEVVAFLRDSVPPAQHRPIRRRPRSIAPRGPALAKRRRIVVVDDSDTNLDVTATVLRGEGYDVYATQSIDDALGACRRRRPDLFISDVNMRPRDGFDVIEAIRADPELRSLRVGLISSSVWGDRDRNRARGLGTAGFLIRPFDPGTLVAEVRRMLSAPGRRGDPASRDS